MFRKCPVWLDTVNMYKEIFDLSFRICFFRGGANKLKHLIWEKRNQKSFVRELLCATLSALMICTFVSQLSNVHAAAYTFQQPTIAISEPVNFIDANFENPVCSVTVTMKITDWVETDLAPCVLTDTLWDGLQFVPDSGTVTGDSGVIGFVHHPFG